MSVLARPAATPAYEVPAHALASFQRDGYFIFRDVLSSQEVADLRVAVARAAEDSRSRGMVLNPAGGDISPLGHLLNWDDIGYLIFDPRLLAIARALVQRDDIVYFGDSGCAYGTALARGFHKDNTERVDASHPDWQSDYTLLRFGIYLQDHVRHSGGLKLRAGSHKQVDVATGRRVDVPTRPGDIVVWSLRTTHSGNVVKLRGLTSLSLSPRVEQRLPYWLAQPLEAKRVAMFVTYGVNDHHLQNYLRKHTDLATYPDNYLYQEWLLSRFTPAMEELASAQGATFLRPIAEFGKLYDPNYRHPEPFVRVGKSKPDLYVLKGADRWLHAVGEFLRGFRRPTAPLR